MSDPLLPDGVLDNAFEPVPQAAFDGSRLSREDHAGMSVDAVEPDDQEGKQQQVQEQVPRDVPVDLAHGGHVLRSRLQKCYVQG